MFNADEDATLLNEAFKGFGKLLFYIAKYVSYIIIHIHDEAFKFRQGVTAS